MKYQLKLTHLPTDKTWTTISEEITSEDMVTLKGFCENIAKGEATYLELNCHEGLVYLTEKLLLDSVIVIVKSY